MIWLLHGVVARLRRRALKRIGLLPVLCLGCTDPLTPCDASILDPVVSIQGITDAVSGAVIDSVFITEIWVDGFKEHLPFLLEAPNAFGASVAGDSLICRKACAFGGAEGNWQMLLRRDGFRDLSVTFEARYQHNNAGECPGRLWGPTQLRFQMTPLN